MYMRIRNIWNLYIRCTCVCKTYSIYTVMVHVYAKPIQFIHSMCMCMRKLYRFIHSMYLCIRKLYQFIHSMYMCIRKLCPFIHSMYMCIRKLYPLILTFDVHVYTKTIPIDSYIRCTCVYENYTHSYIRCTCVYENYTH